MSKKYFTYRETGDGTLDRLIIVPKDYDTFPFNVEEGGSYNLAPARVLGLTYPEYLRFVRQAFYDDVSVEGKKGLPVAYWRKGKVLSTFIDLLNAKMEMARLNAKEEDIHA